MTHSQPRRLGRFGYCDAHQKGFYHNKRQAKEAIREQAEKGMRAYRCDVVESLWHIGHLPKDVRRGRTTAREVYG